MIIHSKLEIKKVPQETLILSLGMNPRESALLRQLTESISLPYLTKLFSGCKEDVDDLDEMLTAILDELDLPSNHR